MAEEKTIENELVKAVQSHGGLALKLMSPGYAGLPDRLVLIPGGKIGFVEVKAPGKKPRKLQKVRMRKLRELGFLVFVLDDEKMIGEIIDAICAT